MHWSWAECSVSSTLWILSYSLCAPLPWMSQTTTSVSQTTTPTIFLCGLHSCLFALSGHLQRSIGYLKLNISVLEIIKEVSPNLSTCACLLRTNNSPCFPLDSRGHAQLKSCGQAAALGSHTSPHPTVHSLPTSWPSLCLHLSSLPVFHYQMQAGLGVG